MFKDYLLDKLYILINSLPDEELFLFTELLLVSVFTANIAQSLFDFTSFFTGAFLFFF